MSDKPHDESPPFGVVYFGTLVTVAGGVLMASPWSGGPAILVSGVLLVCTGMVLRALDRLR